MQVALKRSSIAGLSSDVAPLTYDSDRSVCVYPGTPGDRYPSVLLHMLALRRASLTGRRIPYGRAAFYVPMNEWKIKEEFRSLGLNGYSTTLMPLDVDWRAAMNQMLDAIQENPDFKNQMYVGGEFFLKFQKEALRQAVKTIGRAAVTNGKAPVLMLNEQAVMFMGRILAALYPKIRFVVNGPTIPMMPGLKATPSQSVLPAVFPAWAHRRVMSPMLNLVGDMQMDELAEAYRLDPAKIPSFRQVMRRNVAAAIVLQDPLLVKTGSSHTRRGLPPAYYVGYPDLPPEILEKALFPADLRDMIKSSGGKVVYLSGGSFGHARNPVVERFLDDVKRNPGNYIPDDFLVITPMMGYEEDEQERALLKRAGIYQVCGKTPYYSQIFPMIAQIGGVALVSYTAGIIPLVLRSGLLPVNHFPVKPEIPDVRNLYPYIMKKLGLPVRTFMIEDWMNASKPKDYLETFVREQQALQTKYRHILQSYANTIHATDSVSLYLHALDQIKDIFGG